jgi:DNA ligase (NAD+)
VSADEVRTEAEALSCEFTIGKPPLNHMPRLASRRVVFTGQFECLSRAEACRAAEGAGAVVTGHVTAESLVVVGRDPGVKLRKATSLGAELIDEAGFHQLIGRSGS